MRRGNMDKVLAALRALLFLAMRLSIIENEGVA